jgi:Aldolase/RraA
VAGEILVDAGRARGIASFVLDDGIRDADRLTPPPSIAARGVSARGTVKAPGPPAGRQPVAVGGELIAAGDRLVCDHDGAYFVPRAAVEEVSRVRRRGSARRRRSASNLPAASRPVRSSASHRSSTIRCEASGTSSTWRASAPLRALQAEKSGTTVRPRNERASPSSKGRDPDGAVWVCIPIGHAIPPRLLLRPALLTTNSPKAFAMNATES